MWGTLQVTFHYVGYNESGRRIDSTYLQGSPAKIRLGNNALVPGVERNNSGQHDSLVWILCNHMFRHLLYPKV